MKKKLKKFTPVLFLVLTGIIIIPVSMWLSRYTNHPDSAKNIFDEMYQETQKTYRSNNILSQIDDFSIQSSWPSDDPNISEKPFGRYDKDEVPYDYSNITIGFNFGTGNKGVLIDFEWKPNSNITIWYLCRYSQKNNTFTKKIVILEEPRKAGEYINGEAKIKDYLKQYSISKEDLEKHYDEIVTQKILKDWCSIYDSKFSPKSYGKVTIKTQWEDW